MAKSDYGKAAHSSADNEQVRQRWGEILGTNRATSGDGHSVIFKFCSKCNRVVEIRHIKC